MLEMQIKGGMLGGGVIHVCETAVSHEMAEGIPVCSILTRGHETSRNRQNRNSPSQNPGHNHMRNNEHQGLKRGTAIKEDLAQEGRGK